MLDWGPTIKEAEARKEAAQFRRNRDGRWVVFGRADEVQLGRMRVQKRDGRMSEVFVVSKGRPFNVNGVPHVYGYLEDLGSSDRSQGQGGSGGKVCAECGRALMQPGRVLPDSSGIMGEVCPSCARMSRYERSYA